MFELIIVIVLLVVLPYLFHMWITSKYHNQDKLFFGEDYLGDCDDNLNEDNSLSNVGTEGEHK